jgi:hypothetical protein
VAPKPSKPPEAPKPPEPPRRSDADLLEKQH